MDGRDKCLVGGHGRHLFGDITDTFGIGQVDFGDLVSAEEDAVVAVNVQRLDVDQSGTLQLLAQAAIEFNRPKRSAARTFRIVKPVATTDAAGQVAAIADAVAELTDGLAALLQASTGSDRPILLLYDTKSAHSGGRPINKQIEESTDEVSFLFWQLHVPLQ